MTDPAYPLLVAMTVSMVLFQLNHRYASPVLAIFNRWLRWFIFAFGAAYVCRDFALIQRPYPVLVAIFFLLWFLVETLYNWLAIHALSVSPLPLFPRYTANQSGEEWPTQPRLLRVREWLRRQGFRQVQALRAEVGGGSYLRVSVYQDEAAALRVQVMFLPQGNGTITACFELATQLADGRRVVTDNLYTPFGGFYPENWEVARAPWRRSLPGLVARHRTRVAQTGVAVEPWTNEPMTDLNSQQSELDRLNTELGFLHPYHERDDLGQITHEGRYRVWKEIWMLDYLGRATSYE
ncbi:MAG TPA: hypothetical protein VG838_10625 [Opitutaceae bacterium]|nr:hypothetical protein [Opitutaceae bacterium]